MGEGQRASGQASIAQIQKKQRQSLCELAKALSLCEVTKSAVIV